MVNPRRLLPFVACIGLVAPAAAGHDLAAEVAPGVATQLTLDFPVDDAQLANPSGYFPAEPPPPGWSRE